MRCAKLQRGVRIPLRKSTHNVTRIHSIHQCNNDQLSSETLSHETPNTHINIYTRTHIIASRQACVYACMHTHAYTQSSRIFAISINKPTTSEHHSPPMPIPSIYGCDWFVWK
ncbi:unnamed protein product [Schistosoma bovis]|nr:unnamed protein product [Schistosoma bovis]